MSLAAALGFAVLAAGFPPDTPVSDWHAPQFVASIRRGSVSVRGHVRSPTHEALVASESAAARLELRRHIMLPDWWRRASLELLTILPGLVSGEVRMTRDAVAISGAAAGARPSLEALRDVLPADVELVERIYIADIATRPEHCLRLFDELAAEPLRFRRASSEPGSADVGRLTRIAVTMRRCPDLRVTLEGHSDNFGTRRANQRVSTQRASAVRQFLIDQGVDAERIEAAGLGVSQPAAGNDTWEGRAQNRRVEIRRQDPR